MLDIYRYILSKAPKEAISSIEALKVELTWQNKLPQEAINLLLGKDRLISEIRFDVSILDWETKHEVDVKIRRALRKSGIKFAFSNSSNPKLNFYYGQKSIGERPPILAQN